jgi:hypothetical protein
MKLENKNYDVVDANGNLLFRGFLALIMGDNVCFNKLGAFGSGKATVNRSQIRPFNSVEDSSNPQFARTAIW